MVFRLISNKSRHTLCSVILENKDNFGYRHIVFHKTTFFYSLEHQIVKWHQRCEIIINKHDVSNKPNEIKEIQEIEKSERLYMPSKPLLWYAKCKC